MIEHGSALTSAGGAALLLADVVATSTAVAAGILLRFMLSTVRSVVVRGLHRLSAGRRPAH